METLEAEWHETSTRINELLAYWGSVEGRSRDTADRLSSAFALAADILDASRGEAWVGPDLAANRQDLLVMSAKWARAVV